MATAVERFGPVCVRAMSTSTLTDGPFTWWHEADTHARRAFIASAFGWMLDSFDVMLYALVTAALIRDPQLRLTPAVAGQLGSFTLIAAAAGGVLFGVLADRIGRKRALMAAVLLYSTFTAACGFAQSVLQLAIFRVALGFGMGGEWATGVALISETFPARHRSKALAFVQSAWAIGYGLAALVNLVVMPLWGWRGVFFVGIAPALLTLWIRRNLEDPVAWQSTAPRERGQIGALFTADRARVTVAIIAMNAATLFGWWGLNAWIPAYLNLGVDRGGIGLSSQTMSLFVFLMQAGMWLGYVSFGYIADRWGRKRCYVTFLVLASLLLPLYGNLRTPAVLLLLGPLTAFFGTGYYSGFGAVIADLYPTTIRATAAGVCYNVGRLASAAAPFVIGSLAASRGFGPAFTVAGAAFLVAAVAWVGIPDGGAAGTSR